MESVKTFDSAEVLARRNADPAVQREILQDEAERERAAFKLRALEEAERILLRDNPQELAKRELARRQLARTNYLPFVMRFHPDYQPGWVHKDICRQLEKFSHDVAMRRSPRLLMMMPPRHGKSTLTSKTFAAWHLGQHPTHEFMSCSYSGSLSMSFSRMVRQILRDPAYHSLFDARLDPDSQGAEAWLTTDGGGFTSAGIGGAITGKGAHILNIDDPVKNREDAESETARQNAYDWYTSTAYTRLAPGGGVLIILTRWHDDDLAGRVIRAMKANSDADQWVIINYPAIATADETYRNQGEALHPDRYDIKSLKRIKANIGERDFGALYQQNPVPDIGGYFKKPDFEWYDYYDPDAIPKHTVNYAAWDLAIGQRQLNDYTVGGCAALDMDNHLWIRDVHRGKWDSMQIVDEMIAFYLKHKPERTGVEKNMIEMTIAPFLKLELAKRQINNFNYVTLNPGKQDKVARARPIQAMLESRKIHVPHNAPWTQDFIHELLRFPNGVHDDQCDMFAWLGQMLNIMHPVVIPEEKRPTWRDKLSRFTGSDNHKSAMSA